MLTEGATLSQRYTITKALGKGGMGAVYLAQMEALGNKKVAIKEMELQGLSTSELEAAVKQFKTEATFLAHLDHPNLVQVTDFFVEKDKHYLVMAYVTGQTLHQKLKRRGRAFPWDQVREWAISLCDVLHYLHTQDPPILFRDLKPSNIMVEDSGRLKLIDFGIARYSQEGTKTSTFLQGTGTSGFSPIEQYGGGQSTDERSDVYALGATLYMLLTGKIPPDAVSRISLGHKVIPPSQHQSGLPPALDSVILKALAQKPPDRYQTMADLKRDFLAVKTPVAAGNDEPATEDLGTDICLPGAVFGQGDTVPDGPPGPEPAAAAAGGVAVGGTTNKPAPNITIEMFPTAPQTKPPNNTPWIAGASAFAVACVCAMVMAMTGVGPFAKDPLKQPEASATSKVSQAAQNGANSKVVEPPAATVTKEEKPAETIKVKEPRTASAPKPKPRTVRQQPKPKPRVESKPQPAARPKPKAKPASTVPKAKSYPTAPKAKEPSYPTAAPVASARPPQAAPKPPQPAAPPPRTAPRPTANTRPGRPPGMPAHLPDPPPGMPWPVQRSDGSWGPPEGMGPPPGMRPPGGLPGGGPPGYDTSGKKRKGQSDSMW